MLGAIKPSVGRFLFEVCDHCPALKPYLRQWGLRITQEWLGNRVARVQFQGRRSLRLARIDQNFLTFELFWRGVGYYEPITSLVLAELGKAATTFVDAGANIGFYSLLMAVSHPGLKVIAFEPNPKLNRLLRTNVRLNGLKQITCERLALSDEDGIGLLYLSASDMSASLESDFEAPGRTLDLPKATLDGYLSRHGVRGRILIKADVEGHEPSLLRGAVETLRRCEPDVVCEITGPVDKGLVSFLKRAGYGFYQITDQGLLPTESFNLVMRDRLLFLNYLLSTRSAAEVQALWKALEPQVHRLDLTKTSKHVSEAIIRELLQRQQMLTARQTPACESRR